MKDDTEKRLQEQIDTLTKSVERLEYLLSEMMCYTNFPITFYEKQKEHRRVGYARETYALVIKDRYPKDTDR